MFSPSHPPNPRLDSARLTLARYLDPDPLLLTEEANASTNPRFHSLNQSLVQLIDDFAMINFMPLDATSEDSVGALLSHIDHAMQSQEDEEPKEPRDMDKFEVDEGGGDELEDDETRMEALLEREMERRAGGGIADVEI